MVLAPADVEVPNVIAPVFSAKALVPVFMVNVPVAVPVLTVRIGFSPVPAFVPAVSEIVFGVTLLLTVMVPVVSLINPAESMVTAVVLFRLPINRVLMSIAPAVVVFRFTVPAF